MKKIATILCLISAAILTKADVIADWTFEGGSSGPSGAGPYSPEVNNNSGVDSVTSVHATAATYGNVSGNGSAHSYSANTWASGDYWQFTVSAANYQNIAISYDQISSSTGPGVFKLLYSSDGTTFNQVGSDYDVLVNASPNAWSSSSHINSTTYFYDLSSITALNGDSSIIFRIVDDSSSSASQVNGGSTAPTANGTDRIDNFILETVPEPGTWGAISGAGLLGLCGVRAWRQRRQQNAAV
jgi:hypothetical protein